MKPKRFEILGRWPDDDGTGPWVLVGTAWTRFGAVLEGERRQEAFRDVGQVPPDMEVRRRPPNS